MNMNEYNIYVIIYAPTPFINIELVGTAMKDIAHDMIVKHTIVHILK